MCVCAHACTLMHIYTTYIGVPKEASEVVLPPGAGVQVVMSCLMWMLEPSLVLWKSSKCLNYLAISLSSTFILFNVDHYVSDSLKNEKLLLLCKVFY